MKNEEPQINVCGEYMAQVIEMNQYECCTGWFDKLINTLTISNSAVCFRHMKNRYMFVDISVCDLIWIICLCTLFLSSTLSLIFYYEIDNRYKVKAARYYQNELLATEHPDYVKQIYDIIPQKQYNEILDYKLKMKFEQVTNYCYVIKGNDGNQYLREVSDEDYHQAVREFKFKQK